MIRAYYVDREDMSKKPVPVEVVHFYETGRVVLVDARDGKPFVATIEELEGVKAGDESVDTLFVRWLRHVFLCKTCSADGRAGPRASLGDCEEGNRLKEPWLIQEGKVKA